jgi:hypothetical protein
MFKELMHNLIGNIGAQGMANTGIGASQLTASMQNSILRQSAVVRNSANKRVFQGNIEVQQVANGYVVNIGTKEGYEYTTHIAHTIVEVNEIIAAAMVAFQLENK